MSSLCLFAVQPSGFVSHILMRDSVQIQFVHSQIMFFFIFFFYGKYESGHSASEQKIEEAVVNDVMSVRAVLEARTLPASGHRVACDKRQSYKTFESGVFFNQQLSRTVQPIR